MSHKVLAFLAVKIGIWDPTDTVLWFYFEATKKTQKGKLICLIKVNNQNDDDDNVNRNYIIMIIVTNLIITHGCTLRSN